MGNRPGRIDGMYVRRWKFCSSRRSWAEQKPLQEFAYQAWLRSYSRPILASSKPLLSRCGMAASVTHSTVYTCRRQEKVLFLSAKYCGKGISSGWVVALAAQCCLSSVFRTPLLLARRGLNVQLPEGDLPFTGTTRKRHQTAKFVSRDVSSQKIWYQK